MIIWVNVHVVLSRTDLLTVTDISKTCVEVIVRVKVICNTSVDDIKLWLFTVIGQVSRDVIGRLSVKL